MAWQQRRDESHKVPRVKESVGSLKLRASLSLLSGGWGLDGHPLWTGLDQFVSAAIVMFLYSPPWAMRGEWRPFVPSSITSYRGIVKWPRPKSAKYTKTFISKQAQKVSQPASRDSWSWPLWFLRGIPVRAQVIAWLTLYFGNHSFCQWKIISSISQALSARWCRFDGSWSVYVTTF